MLISSIHVRNFRSVRDETISFRDLTVMVGPNGAGKSTILKAIDWFYSTAEVVTEDDFFNGNTDEEIVISITYRDLDAEAKDKFQKYLTGDETLRIEKVIKWDIESNKKLSSTYHGTLPRNPDFARIRENLRTGDRGAQSRKFLDELRESGQYPDLPAWTTISGTEEALKEWEENHSEFCQLSRDDGQFFGFRNVAEGYIGQFTSCLYVPAVRDATDDAEEGKNSVFTELMDLVVRNVLSKKSALQELREEIQEKYENLMSMANLPEVGNLATQLSETLQAFVPTAEVQLEWLPLSELSLPNPRAKMQLVEDGYPSPVDRCGHGLQRAFIFTMLQHLALAQTSDMSDDDETEDKVEEIRKLPSLILIIEEPELYQHPNRQRHFAKILSDLATGATPGVADKTQVIYSSHSPYFVGIDRVDEIRVLKKLDFVDGLPKETKVVHTSLEDVASELWRHDGEPEDVYTAETLTPRLTSIMTPRVNEGFFADLAVLVEGEDDYSALMGMAKVMGVELESYGVSIIPCGGKNNLDRPSVIFRQLGISTYIIWDSDKDMSDGRAEDNHALMRLAGFEEIQDWPSGIFDSCACFQVDLEDSMKNDIGHEKYDEYLCACKEKYSIRKHKHAKKNPNVVRDMIEMATADELAFTSLQNILEKICDLANIGVENGSN